MASEVPKMALTTGRCELTEPRFRLVQNPDPVAILQNPAAADLVVVAMDHLVRDDLLAKLHELGCETGMSAHSYFAKLESQAKEFAKGFTDNPVLATAIAAAALSVIFFGSKGMGARVAAQSGSTTTGARLLYGAHKTAVAAQTAMTVVGAVGSVAATAYIVADRERGIRFGLPMGEHDLDAFLWMSGAAAFKGPQFESFLTALARAEQKFLGQMRRAGQVMGEALDPFPMMPALAGANGGIFVGGSAIEAGGVAVASGGLGLPSQPMIPIIAQRTLAFPIKDERYPVEISDEFGAIPRAENDWKMFLGEYQRGINEVKDAIRMAEKDKVVLARRIQYFDNQLKVIGEVYKSLPEVEGREAIKKVLSRLFTDVVANLKESDTSATLMEHISRELGGLIKSLRELKDYRTYVELGNTPLLRIPKNVFIDKGVIRHAEGRGLRGILEQFLKAAREAKRSGNPIKGDIKDLKDCGRVKEFRVDEGPGYRVYFQMEGDRYRVYRVGRKNDQTPDVDWIRARLGIK